jgi:hypothetical protein
MIVRLRSIHGRSLACSPPKVARDDIPVEQQQPMAGSSGFSSFLTAAAAGANAQFRAPQIRACVLLKPSCATKKIKDKNKNKNKPIETGEVRRTKFAGDV